MNSSTVQVPLIIMPTRTKEIACGKCGRPMLVSDKTVLAFCADCSATLGQKR